MQTFSFNPWYKPTRWLLPSFLCLFYTLGNRSIEKLRISRIQGQTAKILEVRLVQITDLYFLLQILNTCSILSCYSKQWRTNNLLLKWPWLLYFWLLCLYLRGKFILRNLIHSLSVTQTQKHTHWYLWTPK